MSETTTFQDVAGIIGARLMVDPASLTRATTAEDVDGWDSVTHTLLIMEVERQMKVSLPFDDAFELANIGELADLVDRVRAGAAP